MNILLKIIQEEIDKACLDLENRMFFEQAPPPDPAAGGAPPDPAAAGAAPAGEEPPAEEEKDEVAEMIKTLGQQTATNIKKTILSDIQTGNREQPQKIIARVQAEKDKSSIPKGVTRAVNSVQRVFNFKIPDDIKDQAEKDVAKKEEEDKKKKEDEKNKEQSAAGQPTAAGAPAPVTESGLQIALREYLFYKNQYEKRGRK